MLYGKMHFTALPIYIYIGTSRYGYMYIYPGILHSNERTEIKPTFRMCVSHFPNTFGSGLQTDPKGAALPGVVICKYP